MLKKIYIDGFRHFKNFTLKPHFPHTLLCGVNGTGKTSVIDIISRLQNFLIRSAPITFLCTQLDIPRITQEKHSEITTTIKIEMQFGLFEFLYEITIQHDNLNNHTYQSSILTEILHINKILTLQRNRENIFFYSDSMQLLTYNSINHDNSGISFALNYNQNIRMFLTCLEKNIFALSLNPFSTGTYSGDDGRILLYDGSNFAKWFGNILDRNNVNEELQEIYNKIMPIVKGFQKFTNEFSGTEKYILANIHIENMLPYKLYFNELSHGQKILCILYTIFHICPENTLIIIDEFENFLSPIELQPLYGVIQDAFEEKNVQTILISHHQKTLNWFQDCAFLFTYSDDKTCIRLKDFSEENMSISDYLFLNQDDI